jgi:hypothetical protein
MNEYAVAAQRRTRAPDQLSRPLATRRVGSAAARRATTTDRAALPRRAYRVRKGTRSGRSAARTVRYGPATVTATCGRPLAPQRSITAAATSAMTTDRAGLPRRAYRVRVGTRSGRSAAHTCDQRPVMGRRFTTLRPLSPTILPPRTHARTGRTHTRTHLLLAQDLVD